MKVQISILEKRDEKGWVEALARINDLIDADPGTPEGDELELLVTLVELAEAHSF